MTTTKAATKRAERERRRANGEVRCEVWLPKADVAWLRAVSGSLDAHLRDAVSFYRHHHP